MAETPGSTKLKKKVSYILIKKASSGVILLSFMLFLFCGLANEVSFTLILVRSLLVYIVVALITKVLVHILLAYEELNSGKA